MNSNEEKNDNKIEDWEQIESINSIEENQNEQAELSEIETGNKGQPDFDEMISFRHTYLNYRIARCLDTSEHLKATTFRLLMINVFIYSGDVIDILNLL